MVDRERVKGPGRGAGLRGVVILAAALALAGCPFSSEHPLSDPAGAPIDQALVGAWRALDADTGEWRQFTFLPFNEHELVGLIPDLVRYRVEGERLILSIVEDDLFADRQFSSPQELQDFVRANLADPRLYAAPGETREDMVWERVPD